MPPKTDRELLTLAARAIDEILAIPFRDNMQLPLTIRQYLAAIASHRDEWTGETVKTMSVWWPTGACADLDAIRAKAETFFEWPDDAGEKPRDYVTFTSCLLFARDCVNDWQAKHQDILTHLDELEQILKKAKLYASWQPASNAPINEPVLACWADELGYKTVIRAINLQKNNKTEWFELASNGLDYPDDEKLAKSVEKIIDKNWNSDLGAYCLSPASNDKITHWMPLPQPTEQPT